MQAMTAGEARRVRARSGAVRWTPAAVIALIAALAVLVHHETAAGAVARTPASAASVMSGMPGMGSLPSMTMPMDPAGHETAPRAGTPVTDSADGACSGMAMQHCSTANVDTVKLVPPSEPGLGRDDTSNGPPSGRYVPGTVSRAPPDLSVLSRLLL